jgi:hypothetical protein
VIAVPIDIITENTVMNDNRLTNHSGMISTKESSPFAAVLLCPDLAQIGERVHHTDGRSAMESGTRRDHPAVTMKDAFWHTLTVAVSR